MESYLRLQVGQRIGQFGHGRRYCLRRDTVLREYLRRGGRGVGRDIEQRVRRRDVAHRLVLVEQLSAVLLQELLGSDLLVARLRLDEVLDPKRRLKQLPVLEFRNERAIGHRSVLAENLQSDTILVRLAYVGLGEVESHAGEYGIQSLRNLISHISVFCHFRLYNVREMSNIMLKGRIGFLAARRQRGADIRTPPDEMSSSGGDN